MIKQETPDSSGQRVRSLFRIQIQWTFKEPVCKCFIVKIQSVLSRWPALFPVLWLLTAVSATTQMSLMDADSAVFECIR